MNFFLLLDPASAQGLAYSDVASFHFPPASMDGLAALTHDYPNLSLIDLNALLDRVRDIIGQVSNAVTAVLGFSLAAGLLVLIAALAQARTSVDSSPHCCGHLARIGVSSPLRYSANSRS